MINSNELINMNSNDEKDMKKIKELVSLISGNRGRECYYILCCAVEIALAYQPAEPQMKLICVETSKITGKTIRSIEKSVSRVADDIWRHGNRDALNRIFKTTLTQKPKPKNLICSLSEYLWINTAASAIKDDII